MKMVFAKGALAKFLDARARGAEREVTMGLKAAAETERAPAPRARAGGVVIDLDRARLEREWAQRTKDDPNENYPCHCCHRAALSPPTCSKIAILQTAGEDFRAEVSAEVAAGLRDQLGAALKSVAGE
jgi:hypothetical protein